MSGDLFQLSKRDAKFFVNSGGFQEDITISTPTGDKTLLITGFASKHHLNFDSDGLPVSSKNAHVTIDEKLLTDNGYPVRNANQEVFLKKHIVSFKDSSGVEKSYQVKEERADETLGLIYLTLSDFNP